MIIIIASLIIQIEPYIHHGLIFPVVLSGAWQTSPAAFPTLRSSGAAPAGQIHRWTRAHRAAEEDDLLIPFSRGGNVKLDVMGWNVLYNSSRNIEYVA